MENLHVQKIMLTFAPAFERECFSEARKGTNRGSLGEWLKPAVC